MMDHFPSWGTMITFDFVFIIVACTATAFVLTHRHLLLEARANLGAFLLLVGVWMIAGMYAFDLLTMLLLPSIIGFENSMSLMRDIHVSYSWYITFAAQAIIVLGFILIVKKLLYKHVKADEAVSMLQNEIKDRTEAERELRESENRYAQAAEIARLGHYVWDSVDDRCVFCSETHASFHGVTPEVYKNSASPIDGEFRLTNKHDRERVREAYRRLRSGEPIEMEYGVNDGTRELRIREIAKPIFDDKNNVIREVGTTLDVTDLYTSEQQLAQKHRLETIGRFAGGVAHDFNNLLFVILGNLELIQHSGSADSVRDKIDAAFSAAQRGNELTKNMLSFARKARLRPKTLDLTDIIETTKAWAKRVLPTNIEFQTSLPTGLWKVRADPSSLENAILNLLLNAGDAMPGGGEITIESRNVQITVEVAKEMGNEIAAGRYVLLIISDTGHGIEEQDLGEIFTPFFTTKKVGTGSGLGLSMVQGFMQQSGGTIRAVSEPGFGTSFELYFKAESYESTSTEHVAEKWNLPIAAGAKLLVVEDDTAVLDTIVGMLTQAGYLIRTATSGSDALRIFEQDSQVDALVTDIVMPGEIHGKHLVRLLRKKAPKLPVVYLSGYSNDVTNGNNGFRNGEIYLAKPVTRKGLIQAIEEARSSMNPE